MAIYVSIYEYIRVPIIQIGWPYPVAVTLARFVFTQWRLWKNRRQTFNFSFISIRLKQKIVCFG